MDRCTSSSGFDAAFVRRRKSPARTGPMHDLEVNKAQRDGDWSSHAHLDHTGNLGFLGMDIPVYTGLTTAVIGKAMQDVRPSAVESELCYLAPRELSDAGLLKAVTGQKIQRRHVVCEDIPFTKVLEDFWCRPIGSRTKLQSSPLERWNADAGQRFWRMDHSIPGSGAFGIGAPDGWVVYSGDVRRHGHSGWRVDAFEREAKELRPSLLIVETRVGENASIREEDVHQAADEVVARTDGIVVADFGPRNVERLRTFHDVAKARGRRLAITVQDAYLLEYLNLVDSNIPALSWDSVVVLREPEGTENLWKRELYDGPRRKRRHRAGREPRPERVRLVPVVLGHRQPHRHRPTGRDVHLLVLGGVHGRSRPSTSSGS